MIDVGIKARVSSSIEFVHDNKKLAVNDGIAIKSIHP
jgi:hypothetical protein